MQRLDKIISSQFNISRSNARRDIRIGLVTVDGATVKDFGFLTDPDTAEITYKGQPLSYKKFIYILMNKPKGVLSASNDKRRETVVDLVPPELSRSGLFPVGRLDRDTTGLLLITDDGDFAHKVISPKSGIPKTYRVTLDGVIPNDAAEKFRAGITLADGEVCKPAELELLSENTALLTITEGKYHQIKRMFGRLNLGVNELERISIGGLVLPENLPCGECREMTKNEISDIVDIWYAH